MAFRNIQRSKPIIIEKVDVFRGSQIPSQVYCFPELREKRKSTDVAFIISFGICVVILLALMIYALVNSNMQRFIHGYDLCGNICGSVNTRVEGISCSGQDMTNKPFLEGRQCVESCTRSSTFHRCNEEDIGYLPSTVQKLQDESVNLTILCFIGLGLSILALLAFRYFARQFVWTMIILGVLMLFALCGFMWYLYSDSDDYDKSGFLAPCIILTIVAVIFALCILVLTGRINLIIFFFEEAAKIIFSMPLLLLEPMLTFLSGFVVLAIFVYTFLLMGTSGTLQKSDDYIGGYDYVPNGAMIFAMWWNVIMMLWMIQFILACQQMVISGAVATYYFARDKLTIVSPIYNSFYNLVRYHLGTVAFGSFILTTITILKMIIRALARDNGCARLVYYCLKPIENLVKYMTSMGYIETAIHGQPLCRSSIRAINLIVGNLLSAVAMNSIGNFVFFMAKLVVVLITVAIGIAMKLDAIIVTFGGLVALMCIHCFFVVFEIAVDTIFLCYCEDQSVNEGTTNPYYASIELHKKIKEAQIITAALEKAKQKKKK